MPLVGIAATFLWPCCIFSILVLAFKYSCKWMGEVKRRGHREGKVRGGGERGPPCWKSLRSLAKGTVLRSEGGAEWGLRGPRSAGGPHDLFRPGGYLCQSDADGCRHPANPHGAWIQKKKEKETNPQNAGKFVRGHCWEMFHLSG